MKRSASSTQLKLGRESADQQLFYLVYIQNKPISRGFILQVAGKQLDALDSSKTPGQAIEVIVGPT